MLAAALAAGVAGLGCERDTQSPVQPGATNVWLSTPNSYDQAVLISFDTFVGEFSPAPGFRAFPGPAGSGRVLLVADTPFQPGEELVGTIGASGVDALDAPGAAILEVARSDFTIRESVTGYVVRLGR